MTEERVTAISVNVGDVLVRDEYGNNVGAEVTGVRFPLSPDTVVLLTNLPSPYDEVWVATTDFVTVVRGGA